ncbi:MULTISPECIES: OmpA family protein [unclassified Aureispira]|uniref:OmpA family protein n=1 Tax=unclassified Aureispira TaxID=2649989 RepID=UPI0006975152|nr:MULTISPECIES: OmpA family protein [unclassified Aureispira]WMX16291.1 OmpA family protein [Aureispira sp. CCB-E]
MNIKYLVLFLAIVVGLSSCVGKKKYTSLQNTLEASNKDVNRLTKEMSKLMKDLESCNAKLTAAKVDAKELNLRQEQIEDLKGQIEDLKKQRDQQYNTVGDLTVLSKSANENMKETLSQLEKKDKYIKYVQAARTKADSMNLVLAVNLKSVLREGIEDQDIEVKVDKTVVFINLSDKMLYNSGSYKLTPKASEVLGKIAKIVESKPNFEVMVEGYTDNDPISKECIEDNWDLSVKRSTSVVRELQMKYNINPDRLIAAGRGEHNTLVPNDSPENKAINRRTRIIILPKLDQFYDLLSPSSMPK